MSLLCHFEQNKEITSFQFGPVTGAHDKEQYHMGFAALQIQNSKNADVVWDSGLNLFNIIANLYS